MTCGFKESPAMEQRLESDIMNDINIIHQCRTESRNIQPTVDPINIFVKNKHSSAIDPIDNQRIPSAILTHNNEHNDCIISHHTGNKLVQRSPQIDSVPVQTSVMGPVDGFQPDVNDELQVSQHLKEIVRKTKNNTVNEKHELEAEELSWFHLFPYGINELKQERPV